MNRRVLCFSIVLMMAACAGADVQRVPDGKDADIDGIRYYESAPFLLVASNGKGNITSQVIYLPDTTRIMAIDPYAVAASNNSAFEFSNGLLKSASTEVDETLVPKEVVTALGTVASGALAALNKPTEAGIPSEAPPPMLFRLVQLSSGAWALVGGPGQGTDGRPVTIKITKTEEPKPDANVSNSSH